jgi:hypothetical protein
VKEGAGALSLAVIAAALLATAWLALQMTGLSRVVFLALATVIAFAAASAWRRGVDD